MTVTTFSLVLSYVETIHLPYLSFFPLQSGEANYKHCFPDSFEEPGMTFFGQPLTNAF